MTENAIATVREQPIPVVYENIRIETDSGLI